MESDLVYLLRQSILMSVAAAYGPVTFERAMRHPELAGAESTVVLGQWRELVKLGYLEELPGSDGRYVRLSRKGDEATRLHSDPVIWGASAL